MRARKVLPSEPMDDLDRFTTSARASPRCAVWFTSFTICLEFTGVSLYQTAISSLSDV